MYVGGGIVVELDFDDEFEEIIMKFVMILIVLGVE